MMQHHLEPFVNGGRHKVTGEEVEIFIADNEFVLSSLIPFAKSGFAYLIRNIEIMQLMRASCFFEQSTHPRSTGGCISGEIERDRNSTP